MKQALQSFICFFKKETVLCIAGILALISAFFVPPSVAYLQYVDFRVLSLLFCLMLVVAGFQSIGLFGCLGSALLSKVHTTRQLTMVLSLLCFFSSMFITNDVALLTFVPFGIMILTMANLEKLLIPVIVLQTIAANLGRMFTPVGNPQNLYLASAFSIPAGTFLMRMLPLTALSLLLLAAAIFLLHAEPVDIPSAKAKHWPNFKETAVYLALFLICLGCVSHLIPYPLMLILVLAALCFVNRALFKNADYFLLLTFVFFFLFIGNTQRIPAVSDLLHRLIRGRELGAGILLSQCISNVPAAILLSGFTDQAIPLLYGVNIGGLGTLIASLASLISYRFYAGTEHAHTGRYMKIFTLYNIIFLIILAFAAWRFIA